MMLTPDQLSDFRRRTKAFHSRPRHRFSFRCVDGPLEGISISSDQPMTARSSIGFSYFVDTASGGPIVAMYRLGDGPAELRFDTWEKPGARAAGIS